MRSSNYVMNLGKVRICINYVIKVGEVRCSNCVLKVGEVWRSSYLVMKVEEVYMDV